MRRISIRVGLLVFLLLLMSMGGARVDAAVSVQRSSDTGQPGDSISFYGTAIPESWVSLRAIDQEGNLVYFDAVKADNQGQYSSIFVVPEVDAGTLQVIAGQGNDGAADSLTIIGPDPPPSDGGGGEGDASVPEPEPEPEPEFKTPTDISGHWARESIMKLIRAGVVAGYPDGTFLADKKVTRAEFTVMLVNALQLPGQTGEVFEDSRGHWARESIAAAAAHGIVSGYDSRHFGPDDPITREQMAVMAAKAAKLQAAADISTFIDYDQISPWARDSVVKAVQNGSIKGYPDGSFRPQGYATRAEAVSVIVNSIK